MHTPMSSMRGIRLQATTSRCCYSTAGEFVRAQFYVRRLNNSELANAESLWLGIKVERRMDNREAMLQLASQLKKRFPQSKELALYEKGAFNE